MTDFSDTIVAPATAPAASGVAVIRVSGDRSRELLAQVFRSLRSPVKSPREMIYGKIVDPFDQTHPVLDVGLAVYFEGPSSYTGEDTFELQLHGSPIVVRRTVRALLQCGARMAEPGEFTRRAFLNDKLDLLQVEAVGDIIHASSEAALRVAQEQLAGSYSEAVRLFGEPLRDVLAEIEAHIDFPEEDISPDSTAQMQLAVQNATREVEAALQTVDYGITLREGFRVVLYGLPNAGKSSMLNALLGTERAIVTDISGTTRDTIEESAEYDGYRFVFCDTAGISETDDTVEQIGVLRSKDRLNWADLVVVVMDSTATDTAAFDALIEPLGTLGKSVWVVANKADAVEGAIELPKSLAGYQSFELSATRGDGIANFKKALVALQEQQGQDASASSFLVTNERQRHCLLRASSALQETLAAMSALMPLEVVSAELRIALKALEEIIGQTSTEDILGRIFSKFCIGK